MELFYNDGTIVVPSAKEQEVVNNTVFLFRQTQNDRDRAFQYFDGLNLIEYIDDSVRRFNTNIDEREGIEDWQAGVHDPFTRNKVLGILGRILEVLPIASFVGRSDEDTLRASVASDLYNYVEEQDEYDELMIHVLLEAIVKGTAIGYEDVEYQERKIRDVVGIGDDVTVTEKTLKTTKLTGSIVPLEEFYPSSVSIRKIKDMPFCFWRKTIPLSKFVEQYGHYKKSELVGGKRTFTESENMPYYHDFIDSSTPDGAVEVIKFFDKLNDQFIIIANGIWLNPIAGEEIMPLPWNHKELPFWEIKYDVFGDFFYGKSLPDRLKSMQDVLNVLTNMLLDQSFLTIFPPLLTAGMDDIEDDYLRPGRRTPVDTQGMALDKSFHVLQTPTPQGWHQFILQYTRSVMEESSMDKVSQGVAGQGDRTTAFEIRTAAEGVSAMLQLFARFINNGIKRKAMLKLPNILQFGLNPEAPLVQGVLDNSSTSKGFQAITRRGISLTGGKRGTRIIEMFETKEKQPTRAQIKARAKLATIDSGVETEIVAITPEYIRNVSYDVKLVTNPRNDKTKEVEKAIQLEKVQVYSTFFPDLINRQELAAQTAEKLGDDPTKMIMQQQPQQPGMPGDPAAGGGQQGNNASNMTRGAKSGGMQELAALQGLMTQ